MTSNSSSPSGSINTLQIALIAMKERCQRQQKRVEELERENLLMAEVRADLYNEVKRLHETNVKLREKNLQLNNELRLKSNECVEVREALSKSKTNNSSSARQLERLQNEVSMIANRERRASNRGSRAKDSIDEDHPTEMLMSLTPDNDTSSLDNISYSQFNEEDSCKLLEKTTSRMSTIKQTLLSEQQAIMEAIQTLEHRQSVSARNAESLISASLAAAQKLSVSEENAESSSVKEDRKCPMCEAAFPQTVSHDEFESHVVEHFSGFEESETLTNFDTLPDAYWSGASGTSQEEESMYR